MYQVARPCRGGWMDKPNMLLLGAGGHARACLDVIEQHGGYSILGLIGQPHEQGGNVLGYPVLGNDDDVPAMRASVALAMVAIGQIRSPQPRKRAYQLLVREGFELPVIVSPLAYVSPHAKLGPGTIVMHGAIVNAGATIGANCIINSNALVEHDAVLGDHCHIATAAVVNGQVEIGEGVFVGSHASICQGIRVVSGALINMGEQVFDDVAARRAEE